MKFSLIIPTYNRSKFILKAIQSVLGQTYSDFEIIVVDDGSIDDTETVIKSIACPQLFYYKKVNSERGAARNFGIFNAQGEYITFLDSDDMLYPNHLKVAMDVISKNNAPEAFHLGYEIKQEDGKVISKINQLPPNANDLLIEGNILSCRGVFLRSDVARNNLFDENRTLSGVEDWELWLRIAAQYPIHTENSITSAIVSHDDRSVVNTSKEKLVSRFNLLFESVLSSPGILNYYKDKIHIFKSSCYTYIALHLALTKKYKGDAIKYLWKGVKENPGTIFTRRFLAIIKHLLV